MGGVLEGVQESSTLTGRQIELARTTINDVDGNDAGDLFAVWLDSNYMLVSLIQLLGINGKGSYRVAT